MKNENTTTGAGTLAAAQNNPTLVRYGYFQSRATDTTTFRVGRDGRATFRDIHAVDDSGSIVGNVCAVRVNDAATEQQTNNRIFQILRLLELGRQASVNAQ
jgi:hypothetical protein